MTRPQLIHHARVCIAQSRAFRVRARRFSFVLLEQAAKARREAGQARHFIQRDMFGEQA